MEDFLRYDFRTFVTAPALSMTKSWAPIQHIQVMRNTSVINIASKHTSTTKIHVQHNSQISSKTMKLVEISQYHEGVANIPIII